MSRAPLEWGGHAEHWPQGHYTIGPGGNREHFQWQDSAQWQDRLMAAQVFLDAYDQQMAVLSHDACVQQAEFASSCLEVAAHPIPPMEQWQSPTSQEHLEFLPSQPWHVQELQEEREAASGTQEKVRQLVRDLLEQPSRQHSSKQPDTQTEEVVGPPGCFSASQGSSCPGGSSADQLSPTRPKSPARTVKYPAKMCHPPGVFPSRPFSKPVPRHANTQACHEDPTLGIFHWSRSGNGLSRSRAVLEDFVALIIDVPRQERATFTIFGENDKLRPEQEKLMGRLTSWIRSSQCAPGTAPPESRQAADDSQEEKHVTNVTASGVVGPSMASRTEQAAAGHPTLGFREQHPRGSSDALCSRPEMENRRAGASHSASSPGEATRPGEADSKHGSEQRVVQFSASAPKAQGAVDEQEQQAVGTGWTTSGCSWDGGSEWHHSAGGRRDRHSAKAQRDEDWTWHASAGWDAWTPGLSLSWSRPNHADASEHAKTWEPWSTVSEQPQQQEAPLAPLSAPPPPAPARKELTLLELIDVPAVPHRSISDKDVEALLRLEVAECLAQPASARQTASVAAAARTDRTKQAIEFQ